MQLESNYIVSIRTDYSYVYFVIALRGITGVTTPQRCCQRICFRLEAENRVLNMTGFRSPEVMKYWLKITDLYIENIVNW